MEEKYAWCPMVITHTTYRHPLIEAAKIGDLEECRFLLLARIHDREDILKAIRQPFKEITFAEVNFFFCELSLFCFSLFLFS